MDESEEIEPDGVVSNISVGTLKSTANTVSTIIAHSLLWINMRYSFKCNFALTSWCWRSLGTPAEVYRVKVSRLHAA